MPGRHMGAWGERLDVERLRVLPVDPVAHTAQHREIAQALLGGGRASPRSICHLEAARPMGGGIRRAFPD